VQLCHELIQAVRIIAEIVYQKYLLVHVEGLLAESLQDLEALPVELDLVAHLAHLPRKLLDPCR
jgi:hypothetical protein